MTPQQHLIEQQEHMAKMSESRSWPRWPVLPMINRELHATSWVGILIETSKGIALYEGVNMFADLSRLTEITPLMLSPEEIYERGWRVD